MRQRLIALAMLLAFALVATGCADDKVINGVKYGPYGLFDENEEKNPEIQYETVGGNIFWSIVFSETLIVPLWLCGYQLYEPTGPKLPAKGQKY